MKKLLVIPLAALTYYIFGVAFDLPVVKHVLAIMYVAQVLVVLLKKYDGVFEVELDPGGVKRVNFVIEGDPETMIERKHELWFKVKKDRS